METSAPYCPRCRARVAPEPTRASYERRRGGGGGGGASGGHAMRRLVVLALVAAACGAAYHYRYRVWFGRDAAYAVAIRDAEQFKAPLSLTIKKSVSVPQFGGVALAGAGGSLMPSSEPIYVLEAGGFVQLGVVSTGERTVDTISSYAPASSSPTQVEVKQSYSSATASLTALGQKEAAAWTDAGDAWRVPIGTRQVYEVEKVGEPATTAAGVETREVEFSWRWVPNDVGKAFDTNGSAFGPMNARARSVAELLGWSTSNLYRAVARLERRAGGDWRVAEIKKSEHFDRRKELSAF